MKNIITNQKEYVIFGVTIILDMKAMLIEIKHQLKNILKDILKDKNGLKKSDMFKIQLTCDM